MTDDEFQIMESYNKKLNDTCRERISRKIKTCSMCHGKGNLNNPHWDMSPEIKICHACKGDGYVDCSA